MDSYFLTFKDNSPLARHFIELYGFESRKQGIAYAKAHFPLDFETVSTCDEFAPMVSEHRYPLGTVEYSLDLMLKCEITL